MSCTGKLLDAFITNYKADFFCEIIFDATWRPSHVVICQLNHTQTVLLLSWSNLTLMITIVVIVQLLFLIIRLPHVCTRCPYLPLNITLIPCMYICYVWTCNLWEIRFLPWPAEARMTLTWHRTFIPVITWELSEAFYLTEAFRQQCLSDLDSS